MQKNQKIIQKDIIPRPPIWISIKITSCPKNEKSDPILLTVSPVTQTDENDVNKASINDIGVWEDVEIGKLSNREPTKITNKKAKIIICAGRTFSHVRKNCKWDTRLTKTINSSSWEIKNVMWKEGKKRSEIGALEEKV